MKVVITGSNGFIAKNLIVRLREAGYDDLVLIDRSTAIDDIRSSLSDVDFVFHLAGVNRPTEENEYFTGNVELTRTIFSALALSGRKVPVVLSSSTQAEHENPYGESKRAAEELALSYMDGEGVPVYVFRLPNVFGKWSRPNYNSVVATFCYNTAHGLPIKINDPDAALNLVYIDDVCDSFISLLEAPQSGGYKTVQNSYSTTVGIVAELIEKFKLSRETQVIEEVGGGMTRALYSTYLSFLKPEQFSFAVTGHHDPRGTFVEVLKTPATGQISFFTAHAGVTRGGHYHHSKNEKFIVLKGIAKYRFKHILTGEKFELVTHSSEYKIVETIPGWAHDITNIGNEEMIVMLWANEIFDRSRPDTIQEVLA